MDLRKIGQLQLPVVSAGKAIGMVSRLELISALERSLSRGEDDAEAAQ